MNVFSSIFCCSRIESKDVMCSHDSDQKPKMPCSVLRLLAFFPSWVCAGAPVIPASSVLCQFRLAFEHSIVTTDANADHASSRSLGAAPAQPSRGHHTVTLQSPKDHMQVHHGRSPDSHPSSSFCQSRCQSHTAHGTEKNAQETESLILMFYRFLTSFYVAFWHSALAQN